MYLRATTFNSQAHPRNPQVSDRRNPQNPTQPAPHIRFDPTPPRRLSSPPRHALLCFTGSRRAIRGELDCCAHHFCFVCIMAWARVASTCPFCKARVRTIRRPPVPGRLPYERVVTVAQRLQVFHPTLGNESSLVGADPAANSTCSVCSCTNDEDLLLLCELCDVAAHTYCAGLGTTVPEGDWFCNDCATSKEEHSRLEVDNDDDGGSSDQGEELEITIEVPTAEPVVDEGHSRSSVRPTHARTSGGPVPVPNSTDADEYYYRDNLVRANTAWSSGPFQVPSIYDDVDEDYRTSPVHVANVPRSGPVPSIYDIVDDDDYATTAARRSNARSAQADRRAENSPSSSDESLCLGSPQDKPRSVRVFLNAHASFGMERARTLRNSRNLTSRITELRQNWSALRAGSVGFDAHLHNNRRRNGTGITEDHQGCATSTTISGHANRTSPKDTRHVSKAWKMLEMAKSSGGARKKTCDKPSSLDCTPRFSMGNRSTSFSPIDTILGQMNRSLSTGVVQRSTVKCEPGAKTDNTLPKKDIEGHRSVHGNSHALVLERTGSFQDRMVNQEISPNGKVASSRHGQDNLGQRTGSSCGSKLASSSRSQHVDPTLESFCDSSGSGKPKMEDALRPFSNSLSSGRSTVTSALQFVSSQSGTMESPEDPSAVPVATSNEISPAAAPVEVRKKPGSDRHGSKRKHRSEASDDQGSKKLKKSSKIAKGEISTLVMRELKILKIDKTHGSDRFKAVARAATHTVLASCGLEHSPELALALPKPVCKHKPPKPSAVPNTCKECLRDFVKEAISLVLAGEQTDHAAAPC